MPEMIDVENLSWKSLSKEYAALDQRRRELDEMQVLLKRREFAQRQRNPTLRDAIVFQSRRPNGPEPANGRTLKECFEAGLI